MNHFFWKHDNKFYGKDQYHMSSLLKKEKIEDKQKVNRNILEFRAYTE